MIRLLATLLLLCASAVTAANRDTITAKSYVVMDFDGKVILSKNAYAIQPIASITKLFVAEAISKSDEQDGTRITIQPADIVAYNRVLIPGAVYTQEQLLNLALVSSNNSATYALTHYSRAKIFDSISTTIAEKNLQSVSLEEPSGLSSANRANAIDLAQYLLSIRDEYFARISAQRDIKIGGNVYKSTNPLIGQPGWNFLVSKTGYTAPAGGCLAVITGIGGKFYAVVVLGAASVPERWQDLIRIRQLLAPQDKFWQFNHGTHQPAHPRNSKKSPHRKRK